MLFTVTFAGYYASAIVAGYTIFNADGTIAQARTTTGVINVAGNVFQVVVSTNVLPIPCSIVWDDGGAPANYAATAYNGGNSSTTVIVNDNLVC